MVDPMSEQLTRWEKLSDQEKIDIGRCFAFIAVGKYTSPLAETAKPNREAPPVKQTFRNSGNNWQDYSPPSVSKS
jgi:hypothetical protein